MTRSNESTFCWLCRSISLPIDNLATTESTYLTPEMFRITDSKYGNSLPRFRCTTCKFIQCADLKNLIDLYSKMDDSEYEQGELARERQANGLLRKMRECPKGKWLDVGCGAGILVVAAQRMGWDAT